MDESPESSIRGRESGSSPDCIYEVSSWCRSTLEKGRLFREQPSSHLTGRLHDSHDELPPWQQGKRAGKRNMHCKCIIFALPKWHGNIIYCTDSSHPWLLERRYVYSENTPALHRKEWDLGCNNFFFFERHLYAKIKRPYSNESEHK